MPNQSKTVFCVFSGVSTQGCNDTPKHICTLLETCHHSLLGPAVVFSSAPPLPVCCLLSLHSGSWPGGAHQCYRLHLFPRLTCHWFAWLPSTQLHLYLVVFIYCEGTTHSTEFGIRKCWHLLCLLFPCWAYRDHDVIVKPWSLFISTD